MPTCCAPNCTKTEKTNEGLAFFRLPWQNRDRLKIWLSKLKLVHQPAAHARICRDHFEDRFLVVHQKYILAPHLYKEKKINLTDDAVPTIFEHTTVEKPRLSSEARTRKRRRIEVSNAIFLQIGPPPTPS